MFLQRIAEQLLLFDYSLIILFPVAKIICFFPEYLSSLFFTLLYFFRIYMLRE